MDHEGRMAQVAKAIESQTADIAALVKTHTESSAAPAGTMKGLGRASEELLLLRACHQYLVSVPCDHRSRRARASARECAAVRSSWGFHKAAEGRLQAKVTPRLAIGLAGPFWGAGDKELDAYL